MTEYWDQLSMMELVEGTWTIVRPSVMDVFPLYPHTLVILDTNFNLHLYDETTDVGTIIVPRADFLSLVQDTFETYRPYNYNFVNLYKGWVTYSDGCYFVHINYTFNVSGLSFHVALQPVASITIQVDNYYDTTVIFDSFKDNCYNLAADPGSGWTLIYTQSYAYVSVESSNTYGVFSGAGVFSGEEVETYFHASASNIAVKPNAFEGWENQGTLCTNIKIEADSFELISAIPMVNAVEIYPPDSDPPEYRYRYISIFECGTSPNASYTGKYNYRAPEIVIDNIEYVRYRMCGFYHPDPNTTERYITEYQGFISPSGKTLDDIYFEKEYEYNVASAEFNEWLDAYANHREAKYCYDAGELYELDEQKKGELSDIFTFKPWADYSYVYNSDLADNSSWADFKYLFNMEDYTFTNRGAARIQNYPGILGLVDSDYPTTPVAGMTMLNVEEVWLGDIEKLDIGLSTYRVKEAMRLVRYLYMRTDYTIYVLTTNLKHKISPTSISTDGDYIHIGGSFVVDTAPLGGYYFSNGVPGKPVYVNTLVPPISELVDVSSGVLPKYNTIGVSGEAYVKLMGYDTCLVHGSIQPHRAVLAGRVYEEDVSETLPSGTGYSSVEFGALSYICGISGAIYTESGDFNWTLWDSTASKIQTSLLYSEGDIFIATPDDTHSLYKSVEDSPNFLYSDTGLPEGVIIYDIEEELYADR